MALFVSIICGLLAVSISINVILSLLLKDKGIKKIEDFNENIVVREETKEENKKVRENEKEKIDKIVSSSDVMDNFNDIMSDD